MRRLISFPSMSWIPLAVVLCAAAGCAKSGYHKDSSFFMGTLIEVVSDDSRAAGIVFDEFSRLEKIFNAFDAHSELSLLHDRGVITASEDLYACLKDARDVFRRSNGAFDVTIAPVSFLWKKALEEKKQPSQEQVAQALSGVGFDSLYMDDATREIRFLKPGMGIDLGGIAKGYAVDRAVEKLKEAGIRSAIINAGGDLYCLGTRDARPWRVGVRDPRNPQKVVAQVDAQDEAVATSGDYEQSFVVEGKRYSHIIDPRTGYPVDRGVISATVVAKRAVDADALATVVMVVGPQEAQKMISSGGLRIKYFDREARIHDL